MKYVANILTDEPFTDDGLYNVVHNASELIPGIPTLIVGWERTKAEHPEASIIEWKVTDDIYWTYGKYERRDKYEANVKKFQEMAFKRFIDSVGYVFYDIITSDESRFDDFIDTLKADVTKTIYVTGNMMYVFIDSMFKVLGISLRDCDYVNETYKKRIFSAIYGNETVNLLKNDSTVTKEIRQKVRGRAYILPYICS